MAAHRRFYNKLSYSAIVRGYLHSCVACDVARGITHIHTSALLHMLCHPSARPQAWFRKSYWSPVSTRCKQPKLSLVSLPPLSMLVTFVGAGLPAWARMSAHSDSHDDSSDDWSRNT